MFFKRLNEKCHIKKKSFKKDAGAFKAQKTFVNKQKPIIFDIGAFVGQISAKYAEIFPGGQIYAFEPFQDSFSNLQKLTKQHPNIYPANLAVLDFVGTTQLNINNDPTCNSIFPRPTNAVKYYSPSSENVQNVEVNTTTVDDFCQQKQIKFIDILKIDVEGAEIKVLSGATQMLAQHAVGLIYCEVMFISHYQGGCLYHDIAEYLANYGYSLFNLFNLKQAGNGQLRWGNAIFICPQLRDDNV